jgi:hypothetical protein
MATSTLACDENNDIYLPDGRNLLLLTGRDAVVQNVRAACLLRLGEDIYNQNNGIDFFGNIFTPQQNYDAARKDVTTAILNVPDVLSIDSLTITITQNTFDYVANIVTVYGPATVSST